MSETTQTDNRKARREAMAAREAQLEREARSHGVTERDTRPRAYAMGRLDGELLERVLCVDALIGFARAAAKAGQGPRANVIRQLARSMLELRGRATAAPELSDADLEHVLELVGGKREGQ